MGNFKEDIALIEALVFDVDGVFTDGGITLLPDGDFLRRFNAKDCYAMGRALAAGLKVCVISRGSGNLLDTWFGVMGVDEVHMSCFDGKANYLRAFMERHGLRREQVLYMGDDVPDVECMLEVGMPVCPADACVDVLSVARYVSQFGGGDGCVRDVVEQVLRAKGQW